MTHFVNLGHIKITSEYKRPTVLFGKSNTDQSYYEPTSSRIQNSKGMSNNNQTYMTIKEAFDVPVKPNGITREELYQSSNNSINSIKEELKTKNQKSKLDNLIEKSTEFIEKNTTQMNTTQG